MFIGSGKEVVSYLKKAQAGSRLAGKESKKKRTRRQPVFLRVLRGRVKVR